MYNKWMKINVPKMTRKDTQKMTGSTKNVKWPREKETLHGTHGRGEEVTKQVKNTRQLEINLSRVAERKKGTLRKIL